jgi:hypothetical protein
MGKDQIEGQTVRESPCNEFFNHVKNVFQFLLDEYGFEVVLNAEFKTGEHCLIILESKDCKIKFYRSLGEVNCLFGTLKSINGLVDSQRGVREWYYSQSILNFLMNNLKPPSDLHSSTFKKLDVLEELNEIAHKIAPQCKQIFEFFKEDGFEERQKTLDSFLQKRYAEMRKAL